MIKRLSNKMTLVGTWYEVKEIRGVGFGIFDEFELLDTREGIYEASCACELMYMEDQKCKFTTRKYVGGVHYIGYYYVIEKIKTGWFTYEQRVFKNHTLVAVCPSVADAVMVINRIEYNNNESK